MCRWMCCARPVRKQLEWISALQMICVLLFRYGCVFVCMCMCGCEYVSGSKCEWGGLLGLAISGHCLLSYRQLLHAITIYIFIYIYG